MNVVRFYDEIEDSKLKFAVIVSRYQGKWVFCKHKDRNTYECPGGRREKEDADIQETAKRELYEETGAVEYTLKEVCVYSITGQDGIKENSSRETFGMLYFAEINKFGELPNYEIEKVEFFDELPDNWTYPDMQPILLEKVRGEII